MYPYINYVYLSEHNQKEHPDIILKDQSLRDPNTPRKRTGPQNVEKIKETYKYICNNCGGTFPYPGSLQYHICDNNTKKLSDFMFQCPKCESLFKHNALIVHHKNMHNVFPDGFEVSLHNTNDFFRVFFKD